MTALAIERAPSPATPLRFLMTVPLWGMAAGALLAMHGELALATRWSPITVALVHAITLGVLGNAMLGSLLQFLPVVAGVRVPGSRFAPLLHGTFNLGGVLLVVGLAGGRRALLMPAAALLLLSLGAFALAALAGFRPAAYLRLARIGIAIALLCLLATAVFGAALAGTMAGHFPLPLDRATDIHAALGLLGWVVLLTASVASVTMPMFQGTPGYPPRVFAAWIAGAVLALAAGASLRAVGAQAATLGLLAGVPALAFALGLMALQARARHNRNLALARFWRAGLAAVAAAALLAMLAPQLPLARADILLGVLALGIGLPFLVLGMLLEIVAFLGWIRLHRGAGRGTRLPGVHALLPDGDKARVFALHALAALLLLAAASFPLAWLARAAGLALLFAHGGLLLALLGAWRRAGRFLIDLGARA